MIRIFLDDPLFGGLHGPELTGSHDLTDITSAGQRPFPAGITARGKSHWLTKESHEKETGTMSRRADGKTETAADSKFFDLRESGYTGPVDQDGNPVEDMDQWIRDHS